MTLEYSLLLNHTGNPEVTPPLHLQQVTTSLWYLKRKHNASDDLHEVILSHLLTISMRKKLLT